MKRFLLAVAVLLSAACDGAMTAPAADEVTLQSTSVSSLLAAPSPIPRSMENYANICTTLGYDYGTFVYSNAAWVNGITVPVSLWDVRVGEIYIKASPDLTSAEWTSSFGIDAVLTWNGNSFYEYKFAEERTGGTGYIAPPNNHGATMPIVKMMFCFDFELEIAAAGSETFARDYDWTIDKSSATTAVTIDRSASAVNVTYRVVLTPVATDAGWAVAGTYSIKNNGFYRADVTSGDVTLSGLGSIGSSCTAPFRVEAQATINCTFGSAVPNGDPRTATISLVTSGQILESGGGAIIGTGSIDGATTTVDFAFDTPATVTNGQVLVLDDKYGNLGTASVGSSSFTYTMPLPVYAECGPHTFVNTASFTGETVSGSDSHSVSVEVTGCTTPPRSCTYTQGYWKTHSLQGPAPYDDGWQELGSLEERTTFFLAGQTWMEVFNTPPHGRAYFILAHQYMAAKLNLLNGASSTTAVTAAITQAEAIFAANTPAALKANAALSAQAKSLASTLDKFNNGEIGPGHCD